MGTLHPHPTVRPCSTSHLAQAPHKHIKSQPNSMLAAIPGPYQEDGGEKQVGLPAQGGLGHPAHPQGRTCMCKAFGGGTAQGAAPTSSHAAWLLLALMLPPSSTGAAVVPRNVPHAPAKPWHLGATPAHRGAATPRRGHCQHPDPQSCSPAHAAASSTPRPLQR